MSCAPCSNGIRLQSNAARTRRPFERPRRSIKLPHKATARLGGWFKIPSLAVLLLTYDFSHGIVRGARASGCDRTLLSARRMLDRSGIPCHVGCSDPTDSVGMVGNLH